MMQQSRNGHAQAALGDCSGNVWYDVGVKMLCIGAIDTSPMRDDRKGTSIMDTSIALAASRFWPKVDVRGDDDCWLWTASLMGGGYGQFSYVTSSSKTAHRFSYELHYGPIPTGMDVCHTCDIPLCVNPKHLFLGTHKDNMEDMKQKGRHWNGCGIDDRAPRQRPYVPLPRSKQKRAMVAATPESDPFKVCRQCQQSLPSTPEFFYRNSTYSSGLLPYCKQCHRQRRAYVSVKKPYVSVKKPRIIDGQKLCSKCKEMKPVDQFNKCARTSFGLNPTCRACINAYRTAKRSQGISSAEVQG